MSDDRITGVAGLNADAGAPKAAGDGETPAQTPALVWPPPDDDITSWEVMDLDEGAGPLAGEPSPAQSPPIEASGPAPAQQECPESRPVHASSDVSPPTSSPEPVDRAADAPTLWLPPDFRPAADTWEPPPSRTSAWLSESAELERPIVPVALHRRGWRPVWLVIPVLAAAVAVGFGVAVLKRLPARAATPGLGHVIIESSPTAARVVVDGKFRGETPLQLQLPPGRHDLQVEAPAGRRSLTLDVASEATVTQRFDFGAATPVAPQRRSEMAPTSGAGAPARVQQAGTPVTTPARPAASDPAVPAPSHVARGPGQTASQPQASTTPGKAPAAAASRVPSPATPPAPPREAASRPPKPAAPTPPAATQPGVLVARAPLALTIVEGSKSLGTSGGRLILSPGRHDLEFVNDALEVRVQRTVVIESGRQQTIEVEVPHGRVSLNAQPWAEVWAGGERLGETPLGNVSLPVGQYEFVFRHPQLGERRATAVVRASTPTRVAVSFE